MNKLEEAIIYATVMHQGKVRKLVNTPFILHPLEVAQILATMTDDQDVITAGILHDIVEDTDGTLTEIEKRFGERVAFLVSSELDAETISACIARDPGQVEAYAKLMAGLAHTIHEVEVSPEDGFPSAMERIGDYIEGGIGREDRGLADRCMALLNALPETGTMLHGDFHTGNVFLQRGEPLLIDMDRLATGHPILEISDLYYFYVLLGEDEPGVIERFMGFSCDTARAFFRSFLKHYIGTGDEMRLNEISEKASLIGYSRLIRKIRKQRKPADADHRLVQRCVERIADLTDRLDTLAF